MNEFNLNTIEVHKLDILKQSNILVTGGTGFFGSWIIKFVHFLNDNHDFNINLYILARKITSSISELVRLRNDIHFIQKDIRNLNEIPIEINYIIHAACSPNNIEHMSNPIETMDIISNGIKQLLDSVLNLPSLKKIINLSSGQIYGNSNNTLIGENDYGKVNCNSIKSIYLESKRYSETLSKAYESLYKLPIVQVRPFSFIGPFMSLDKPWAINNFIHDAIKFKKIKIIGNGKPIRSYMYPSDMVYWLFNILVNKNNGISYNLGSSEGISLFDLAEKIKDKLGNDVDIDVLNMNYDSNIFIPDTSFTMSELNVSIKVNIDDALDKTIKFNYK